MPKNIVVLSDGTWQDIDGSNPLSNIAILHNYLEFSRTKQVFRYDAGVGSTGNFFTRVRGGATGNGISLNIQQLYQFIAEHYDEDDQIFLFGFSRGAFTVRSLAGLIRTVGIMRAEEITDERVANAYEIYKIVDEVNKAEKPQAIEFRQRYSYPLEQTSIHFLGVFDTVEALGVPRLIAQGRVLNPQRFHDANLSGLIKTARHALAIDEQRIDFRPTLWIADPNTTNSEQRWFPGVHTDIGGGYDDRQLANVSLSWMIAEAKQQGLLFKPNLNELMATFSEQDSLGTMHRETIRCRREIVRTIPPDGDHSIDHSVKYRHQQQDYNPANIIFADAAEPVAAAEVEGSHNCQLCTIL